MSKGREKPFLTLEQILQKYPPQEEPYTVNGDNPDVTKSAMVSRNENGTIIFALGKDVYQARFLNK